MDGPGTERLQEAAQRLRAEAAALGKLVDQVNEEALPATESAALEFYDAYQSLHGQIDELADDLDGFGSYGGSI